MFFLASTVDFHSPLLWAIFIGWVLSVTIHEFGHGLVASLGGDYTVHERGGLTLNPFQYVDPLGSLIFPAIVFLIGGVPLPGGVTYIREDLLRNRGWRTAVSAAGPVMNLLLFLVCLAAVHPKAGWVDSSVSVRQWSNAQIFVAAMAWLQLWSVILNLIPVPPLDGYGMISPYLPLEWQEKLKTPPIPSLCYFGYFMLLTSAPVFSEKVGMLMVQVVNGLGADPYSMNHAFRLALFGG
jgi:Zn-dependent protease